MHLNEKRKILFILAYGVTIWLILIILAPLFRSLEISIFKIVSEYMYFFFEPVCHQIPERSILLNSEPMAVCTRCFAIYFGAFIFLLFIIIQKKIYNLNPGWMIIFSLPAIIDFMLEKLGFYVNIPIIRVLTGLIFGVAIIHLILYSIWDIKRENLMKRDNYYGKSEIN